jgi:hypothetical protein
MSSIYTLIQKTLELGYLSIETENQLQRLLNVPCDRADLDDVVMLKQAIAFGHVKRQATLGKKQPNLPKAAVFQLV